MIVIVFLLGRTCFPARSAWEPFFQGCSNTRVHVFSKYGKLNFTSFPVQWNDFHWPEGNIRFKYDMVRLMAAAATKASPDDAMLFMSDSTVPLKSCAELEALDESRVYLQGKFVPLVIKPGIPVFKGTQWFMAPVRAVRFAAKTAEALSKEGYTSIRKHTFFAAPDEYVLQSFIANKFRSYLSGTFLTYVNWTRPIVGGHPRCLTDVSELGSSFFFARKLCRPCRETL